MKDIMGIEIENMSAASAVRRIMGLLAREPLSVCTVLRADMLLLPVTEGETILEVKYDAFLPDIVRMAVQVPGRQAQACSKYALCRRFD